jgi:hypothetical protein
MSGSQTLLLRASPVSAIHLTHRVGFPLAKQARKSPSAVILGLKFLPVRSGGSLVMPSFLGDLA